MLPVELLFVPGSSINLPTSVELQSSARTVSSVQMYFFYNSQSPLAPRIHNNWRAAREAREKTYNVRVLAGIPPKILLIVPLEDDETDRMIFLMGRELNGDSRIDISAPRLLSIHSRALLFFASAFLSAHRIRSISTPSPPPKRSTIIPRYVRQLRRTRGNSFATARLPAKAASKPACSQRCIWKT